MGFGETKKLGQYNNNQKILLVGEGDFSFSLSLAKAFGSATNITATSFDSQDELGQKYTNGIANVEALKRFGCTVFHSVDAEYMASDKRLVRYDRFVFNFPHSGLQFGNCMYDRNYIVSHQQLVSEFMESARKMLRDEEGEIHIRHMTTYPYHLWEIESLAEKKGF